MYIFVDKKISLWVSNIGELGQSIFSNHTYSYICFHRDSYKYLAGFSNFFFFFFLAILAIPIGSVFVVMVSIHGKVLVGFRLEFLQLGHVTLDNDSRCDLRGHTFRGRVTSDPGSILSTPGTLFRVFLRHSDHFVGTPLERISTTTSAFIYDVRFALPISTISRTWQWWRWMRMTLEDGGTLQRCSIRRFSQHCLFESTSSRLVFLSLSLSQHNSPKQTLL